MNVRMRIQPVPARTGHCVVCGEQTAHCTAYDHDLRGLVCQDDFEPTAIAEINLRNAHIAIPTDSILDGGNQP